MFFQLQLSPFEPAFSSRVGFRNDLQQSLINQGFSSADAQQIASSIAGVPSNVTTDQVLTVNNINTNLLSGNLAFNLQQSGITTPSDITSQVVSGALANTQEIAEATLRDNLAHQLVVQGLTAEQARRVIAGTVIPQSTLDNPLSSPGTGRQLTQGELHDELVASISGVYSPLLSNNKPSNKHSSWLISLSALLTPMLKKSAQKPILFLLSIRYIKT